MRICSLKHAVDSSDSKMGQIRMYLWSKFQVDVSHMRNDVPGNKRDVGFAGKYTYVVNLEALQLQTCPER